MECLDHHEQTMRGGLYHVLNRANLGAKVFRKTGDLVAFEKILYEALQLYKVEFYAYQIMGTHWHLMLRPLVDGEMGRFCKWICGTHTMRHNAHYHSGTKAGLKPSHDDWILNQPCALAGDRECDRYRGTIKRKRFDPFVFLRWMPIPTKGPIEASPRLTGVFDY